MGNPINATDPTGHMTCGPGNEDDGPQCVTKDPNYYNPTLHPENFVKKHGNNNSGPTEFCEQGYGCWTDQVTDVGGTWQDPAVYIAGGAACLMTGFCVEAATALLPSGATACAADAECADEAGQVINTGTNTVYHVVDEEGNTIYVGITQNFDQRAAYWANTRDWAIEPVDPSLIQSLSRFDARAVEQVLIEHYGLDNLANQINSIAQSNPIYQTAIQRGTEILNSIGFFGQ